MNKPLLFVGVSCMKEHAGQNKLYFIAHELGRAGIPVAVLVPDLQENRAFFADKPYVETIFYRSGSALGDAWRKAKVVEQREWSAIWVVGVGIRSFVLRRGAARRSPIVKDFDEFPSMIQSFGRSRRAYLRWIERRLMKQADGFTCASALLEQTVREHRPEIGDRLLRMTVAISAEEHQVDAVRSAEFRAEAKGTPILLYIGSVWRFYEDQLDEVIALAVELERRQQPGLIRILGGGPDLAYFQAKVAQAAVAHRVEFRGHVPRELLASHMDAADALVFPFAANAFNLSRCPTKAFHYAAANRPLVTNRTGEVAVLFGENALYYPERDIRALADRCQEAIARRTSFRSGVAFHDLTWAARAQQFLAWLKLRGWAPS